MVLTFDEVGEALDAIAEHFPQELFSELNGGVCLLPEERRDDEFPDDVYILGEYCDDQMGRYINLYYGSFSALAREEDWTRRDWERELEVTLSHELTHHVEGLAGDRSLERRDRDEREQERARRQGRRPD